MFDNKKVLILVGIVVVILIAGIISFFMNMRPKPQNVVIDVPVKLTWWKITDNVDAYREVIAQFNSLPGNRAVTIELIPKTYSPDYYRNLVTDFARGIGPDIFSLRNDDLPAYKEFVAPIEIIQKSLLTNYKQDFVDLVVRETIDKDKVYGITTYVDNLQLYYNKNLLNQATIYLPPKSWNELSNQTRLLTQRPPNEDIFFRQTIALGTGGRTPEKQEPNIALHQDILPMLIFQSGGHLYDYQTQRSVFGQAKNIQDLNSNLITRENLTTQGRETNRNISETPAYRAVRFYLDFADPTTTRYSWNNKMPLDEEMFIQGRLAYIIHYRNFENKIKQQNPRLPYDIAELPQLDRNNKRTFGKYFMDSISRKLQQNRDKDPRDIDAANKYLKAQEFLEFLSRYEAQFSLASKTGLPSARKDVLKEQAEGDQITRIFAAGALYADNYYKPDVVRTEKIWSDLFERVHYQSMPLSQSLQEAIKEYELILQSGAKPRV